MYVNPTLFRDASMQKHHFRPGKNNTSAFVLNAESKMYVKRSPLNPFAFRYLEVRGQGAMPVFDCQNVFK